MRLLVVVASGFASSKSAIHEQVPRPLQIGRAMHQVLGHLWLRVDREGIDVRHEDLLTMRSSRLRFSESPKVLQLG